MRRTARFVVAASLAAACWALPTAAFADDGPGSDPAPEVAFVSVDDETGILPVDEGAGAPGDPAADPDWISYSVPPECVTSDDTTADRIPCEWMRDTTCTDDTTSDPCPVYTTGGGGEPQPSAIEDKSGGRPENSKGGPEAAGGDPGDVATTTGGTGDGAGPDTSNASDGGAADGGAVIAPAPDDVDTSAGQGSEQSAEPTPATGSDPAADSATTSAQSSEPTQSQPGAPIALVLGIGALAAAGVAGGAFAVRRRMATGRS